MFIYVYGHCYIFLCIDFCLYNFLYPCSLFSLIYNYILDWNRFLYRLDPRTAAAYNDKNCMITKNDVVLKNTLAAQTLDFNDSPKTCPVNHGKNRNIEMDLITRLRATNSYVANNGGNFIHLETTILLHRKKGVSQAKKLKWTQSMDFPHSGAQPNLWGVQVRSKLVNICALSQPKNVAPLNNILNNWVLWVEVPMCVFPGMFMTSVNNVLDCIIGRPLPWLSYMHMHR